MAVVEIQKMVVDLEAKMSEAKTCKMDLRVQLQGYIGNSKTVFEAYDHCVIVEKSKLYRLHKMLMMKSKELEAEIKMEMDGEGMIASNGRIISLVNLEI